MLVLGIETTSRIGSLALIKDGISLGEEIISEDFHHSSGIMPALRNLLSETNIFVKDIDAIGVSIGPGSFTGIRIGVSTGIGLSSALNKPIIGVETMDSVIYSYHESKNKVCVALDAGRGNIYAGIYKKEKNNYKRIRDYICCKSELLPDYSKDAFILSETNRLRAINIAMLAFNMIKSGQEAGEVKPLYVRPFKNIEN